MAELTFHTLDVFTEELFGGNQLAVFPDAPELADEVMLAITREFNYSETVFVRPATAAGALRRLRIFTPGGELPFAGHPTIGTAQLLVELGIAPNEFAFEEGVGLVPISVSRSAAGKLFTWLTAARVPEITPVAVSREELAAVLGIAPQEILSDQRDAPCVCSAGVPFTCVPVRDLEVLRRASVDLARWRNSVASSPAPDLYVFCHGSTLAGCDVQVRMFGPAMNITEDPATGAAAAAFAGYLWKRAGAPGEWTLAQGVEMGRPSKLHVQAIGTGARLEAVRVGGSAVRVSSGTMRVQ